MPGIRVTISTANPPLSVTALRGMTAPVVSQGGYGGWQEIPRPRRKALTFYEGHSPIRVSVPVILDGYRERRSVEPEIGRLERMALPPGASGEPPLVRVSDGVPHADLTWVIEDLAWDDQTVIYSRRGYRLRQAVTVQLLEYVAPDRVRKQTAAKQTRDLAQQASAQAAALSGSPNQPPSRKVADVRAGDTLTVIAARELGDYKRWPEIADLNGLRDPASVTIGDTVRLP